MPTWIQTTIAILTLLQIPQFINARFIQTKQMTAPSEIATETDKHLEALQEAANSVNASTMSELISDIRIENIFRYLQSEPLAELQRNIDRSFKRNLLGFTITLGLVFIGAIVYFDYTRSIQLLVFTGCSALLTVLYLKGIIQNFKEIKHSRASISAEQTHALAESIRQSNDFKKLGELLDGRVKLEDKQSEPKEISE